MISEKDGAVVFDVRVQPRASRDAVVAGAGGVLKIALRAPPVDGAANDALVAMLADRLRVPKRSIEIVRGHGARTKTIRIVGATRAAIEALVRE